MERPLSGIRVIDLSRILSGPFCSQILADLGAEVVKIETPTGDDSRRMGPHLGGQSVSTNGINRNKLGISLNLRHPKGRALFEGLVPISDVLVENFVPGTLEQMGFGYPRLSELNPRLILVRISGYGQYGPYRDRPAFDQCAQAMSGLMALTGSAGGDPMRTGASIGDYVAGLYAALATVSAIRQRDHTGRGQVIDIAMLDSLLSFTALDVGRYLLGYAPKRTGNAHPFAAPSNVYKLADGHVFISAATDRLWQRLTEAMGRPELAADPRFRTPADRERHRLAVDRLVRAWVAGCSVGDVVATLSAALVPCAPVLDISEVAADPHVAARGMIQIVDQPGGILPLAGSPIKFSETPAVAVEIPPTQGQHTDELLSRWLHLGKEEIMRLHQEGAI